MNKAALNRWLARTGWSSIVGGVLAAGLGWLLFSLEATRDFQRFSYDWPFAWSKQPVPTEVVIVGLDETSYKALGQRFHEPWDRALHAQLLRRLKDAGARVVAFDIVFSDPNPNRPEADRALADAIREHGRVVLGGEAVLTADNRGLLNEQLFPPFDLLATNAAAWGDIALPEDPDRVIRRHLPTATEPHSLAWTAAELAGAPATQRSEDANAVRWINYYGPPGTIPKISYQQALDPRAVPPNYFKDKIVFVGQQLATGSGGDLKDTFGTAFTRAGHGPSDGVEIQATICLNLLRGDWLTRLPAWLEITLLTLLGAGLGAGLGRLRHWPAILTALGAALGATLLAWLLFRYQLHWLAWAILVTQAVMALAWYLFCASLRLYVEKQVLKESLEVHLSPARAEQLLELERRARRAERGMWGRRVWRILDTRSAAHEALEAPTNCTWNSARFRFIEGKVVDAVVTGGRAALELERGNGEPRFSVSVFGSTFAEWDGPALEALKGARIRARGRLGVYREEPQLCLEDSRQLEVLSAS